MRPSIPMMSAYFPMMRASAMVTAGELGVFHALHRGPRDAAALAAELSTSVHGMDVLCRGLVAMELLEMEGGRYRNTDFITRNFTPAAEADFTPGLLWTAEAWRIMGGLTEAVRRGGPARTMWQEMEGRPEMGRLFSEYMRAFATLFVPRIQSAVELPAHARTLVDIGGSHGLHAAAFARRHPQLRATVFDLPDSLHGTAGVLGQQGVADRVNTRAGDVVKDDVGGPYDVVLLLSVLHNQRPADLPGIVERAARAVNPGGMMVVHEHFNGTRPLLFPSTFDLTLLVEVGTTLVDAGALQGWMEGAGLRVERRVDFPEDGMGSLLIARRPG